MYKSRRGDFSMFPSLLTKKIARFSPQKIGARSIESGEAFVPPLKTERDLK